MKHDARIDPIDDGLMAEHGDMNIEAALDESVGRVYRYALRSARSEMRDDEGKPLLLARCHSVLSRRGGRRRLF